MSDGLNFTGGDVRVPCYNDDEPPLGERLLGVTTVEAFNAVIAEHFDDQLVLKQEADSFLLYDARLDPRPYLGGGGAKLARDAGGTFELRATDPRAPAPVAVGIRTFDERRAVELAKLFVLGMEWAERRYAFDQHMRWGGGRRRHAEKMANEGT